MIPTKEQKRIFKFVAKRDEDLLIKAYAGTGKTSTVVEAIRYMPKNKRILFMAYNKHIQEELKKRLPKHVNCYTTYGLGLSALKRKYGDEIKFDEFKVDKIINKYEKKWKLHENFNNSNDIFIYKNNLKKLANIARLTLVTKKDYLQSLAEKHEIPFVKPEDYKRTIKILEILSTDRKTFDFTDMIYIPAIDKSVWFYPYDYIIVDEFQDISNAQFKIIQKTIKSNKKTGKQLGRIIVVGDNYQNIYGYNGATGNVFKNFELKKTTKTLNLTYSFRCSKNVTKEAQKIVPNIQALETAPDGIVRNGNVIEETTAGDFVLCRTTAPLIRLFFDLLRENKKAIIKGKDIGTQLLNMIGETKILENIKIFWEGKLREMEKDLRNEGIINPKEYSGYIALEDKVNTLLFLISIVNNVNELKEKIKTLFSDNNFDNKIILSTVHRVKGLEANRVFIIRPDILPMPVKKSWQIAEEQHLKYVAITRAKNELIYDKEWTDEEI